MLCTSASSLPDYAGSEDEPNFCRCLYSHSRPSPPPYSHAKPCHLHRTAPHHPHKLCKMRIACLYCALRAQMTNGAGKKICKNPVLENVQIWGATQKRRQCRNKASYIDFYTHLSATAAVFPSYTHPPPHILFCILEDPSRQRKLTPRCVTAYVNRTLNKCCEWSASGLRVACYTYVVLACRTLKNTKGKDEKLY